jgi:hypothetical protein
MALVHQSFGTTIYPADTSEISVNDRFYPVISSGGDTAATISNMMQIVSITDSTSAVVNASVNSLVTSIAPVLMAQPPLLNCVSNDTVLGNMIWAGPSGSSTTGAWDFVVEIGPYRSAE